MTTIPAQIKSGQFLGLTMLLIWKDHVALLDANMQGSKELNLKSPGCLLWEIWARLGLNKESFGWGSNKSGSFPPRACTQFEEPRLVYQDRLFIMINLGKAWARKRKLWLRLRLRLEQIRLVPTSSLYSIVFLCNNAPLSKLWRFRSEAGICAPGKLVKDQGNGSYVG